jgi:NADPH:quinone reductase
MKAFAIDELGQPGSMRDIQEPDPGEDEVRIRVAAAGLNPFDSAVVQGYLKDQMEHRFPLVPAADASGTVEEVGAGVTGLAVGDEVFGSVGKKYLGGGTLAEFATLSVGTVARKPDSIDHPSAAAVPVAGVTALTMVDAIPTAEGGVVVAIGATGGVGSHLVQLAVRRGFRVLAVCRGQNGDYARELGAADVVDYTAEDVVEAVGSRLPGGVHAIADMHGDKDLVARLADHVRAGGYVTSAVGAADEEAMGRRGIGATNVMGRVKTGPLESLAAMLDKGEIVSPTIRTFPLTEASNALAEVGSGHVRGKIVVVPA